MKNKDSVPECFYRVSVKALVLDESREKFLIVQESNGKWELPGGGLEWAALPHQDVSREVFEEMGIKTKSVKERPAYFITMPHDRTGTWVANVLYETVLEHFDFVESRECVAMKFIGPDEVPKDSHSNVRELARHFVPGDPTD